MIIKENRRSDAYIGTVDLSNPQDMKMVSKIRGMVKEANLHMRDSDNPKRLYVKLQGRGWRMGIRRYNQSLPLPFSETADVYIYER